MDLAIVGWAWDCEISETIRGMGLIDGKHQFPGCNIMWLPLIFPDTGVRIYTYSNLSLGQSVTGIAEVRDFRLQSGWTAFCV